MKNERYGPDVNADDTMDFNEIIKYYTFGEFRNLEGEINHFDYYELGVIGGLYYYTPNDEDWGCIIVMDFKNKLAAYTHFYEMDDMASPPPYDDYAFIAHEGKLVPKFTI